MRMPKSYKKLSNKKNRRKQRVIKKRCWRGVRYRQGRLRKQLRNWRSIRRVRMKHRNSFLMT
jgi:hypothetical protein